MVVSVANDLGASCNVEPNDLKPDPKLTLTNYSDCVLHPLYNNNKPIHR